ncbi:hypothetical protein CXG81DRAFT_15636 [Caulochytrium protostelioides]|uniref:SRP54-type proteins GTP-binding domain-containing protein n=1 Tax=Caulochytrium protostelioides TaxID=1555241 RepID=A0A4P9WYP4_9FUNG|nr:hypothetical protein CXG81DRAFT_15636 [Caulochytrium protostelioides]|eukprot:RKO98649.1 hypothetical protein CXG81DRAFT_15636 [Caulochytrium protostelioides]
METGAVDGGDSDGGDSDGGSDGGRDTADSSTRGWSSALQDVLQRWGLSHPATLTAARLAPVLETVRTQLVQRNVPNAIAAHLTAAVCRGLEGRAAPRGLHPTRALRRLVAVEMQTVLSQILSPKTSIDLLREMRRVQRSEQRPYTIVFVGVNGVGKSTNLAKVAFWLLHNGQRVLIAACDTFRSGAVEQLRVHVRNLSAMEGATIALFERGYGKDAAAIAKEAQAYAAAHGFDVVLIDTAGRMQDNQPLMKSLAKLVAVNQPDRVLFVGEALVGNAALDQLQKFNQALRDHVPAGVGGRGLAGATSAPVPRQIDGFILSKFDTVDDRVGTAISMTFTTGQPIYFVGTGQTYADLRRMNVKLIVRTLLQ